MRLDLTENKTAFKRTAMVFLSIAAVFALLFPYGFILLEAEHNCDGEHCAVCGIIAVFEQTIRTLRNIIVCLFIIFFSLTSCAYFYHLYARGRVFPFAIQDVRLNL